MKALPLEMKALNSANKLGLPFLASFLAALFAALTSRVSENKLFVVDELSLDAPKTKTMVKLFDALKVSKALVVLGENDKNAQLSARNIEGVKTTAYNTINVYDILKYDNMVVTKAAVEKIQEVYA
jgi:large subunit ribosomal protein L4